MKKILTTGLFVLLFFNPASAQKRTTILGDAWTGEVVSTNDRTREITIKYEDKGKPETFVGVLAEGYKIKMKDGSSRELKVSEIPPGTRIRVFAKTKEQDMGGRKARVKLISRIDFLGIDEFVRMRAHLKVSPSTPVTLAESEGVPAANPLKIYLAVAEPEVTETFVEWVNTWNKKQAPKYGSVEIVSDFAQSDICLIVYRGSDKLIVQLSIEVSDARGVAHMLSPVTVYVATRADQGLKVLWRQNLLMDTEKSGTSRGLIEKEFEKRLKARSQTPKK
jgi:hypothetical protein